MEICWATLAECFICERKNFILNSFIYIEPMTRFKYRSDEVKLVSFSDGTSSRIKNKLKTICLSGWEIE